MNATEFERDLERLISKAMPAAAPLMPGKAPDEDLIASMVAELINSLGMVIAFTSGGDPKVMDKRLDAVTQTVYETASHYNQIRGKLSKVDFRQQQEGDEVD
jgi:hypothetical protein